MSSMAVVDTTRDARALPYPQHGKLARRVQQATGRVAWSWATWKDWHHSCVARTRWHKTAITRALQMRADEARERGDTTDYFHPDAVSAVTGMIYGIYHFPTGKWYVGQTINTIQARAREHWWSRAKAGDYFHLALADSADPMCFVSLPLERINKDLWRYPPGPRPGEWRSIERARFRAAATIRERHWVNRLQSMWPRG